MTADPDYLDKETILEKVSLRALAEQAGAVFRGQSSHCPLHGGDNPTAFHLYQDDTRWHCFTNCPRSKNGGDLFDFYMRWKGVDFRTALQDLAAMAVTQPPQVRSSFSDLRSLKPISEKPRSLPGAQWIDRAENFLSYAESELHDDDKGLAAQAYLLAIRGLHLRTWQAFRLGFNPEDIYDRPENWGLPPGRKVWLPRGIVIPGMLNCSPRYIKIRRPATPLDYFTMFLDMVSEELLPPPPKPGPKYGGPRGGKSILFGSDLWIGLPLLLLVEGEFDAMLAWQHAGDMCDVATLGGAARRPNAAELAALSRYFTILVVYDDDEAGQRARRYLAKFPRVEAFEPPAYDLTEYWLRGGDLRAWIAGLVDYSMVRLLIDHGKNLGPEAYEDWTLIRDVAHAASNDLSPLRRS